MRTRRKGNDGSIRSFVTEPKKRSGQIRVAGRTGTNEQILILSVKKPQKGPLRKNKATSPIEVAVAAINALGEDERLQIALDIFEEARSTKDGDDHRNRAIEALISDCPMLKSGQVGRILYPHASQSRGRIQAMREADSVIGIKYGSHYKFPEFQFDIMKGCVKEPVEYANKKLQASKDPYGALSWWKTPVRMGDGLSPLELLEKDALNRTFIDNLFASHRLGM